MRIRGGVLSPGGCLSLPGSLPRVAPRTCVWASSPRQFSPLYSTRQLAQQVNNGLAPDTLEASISQKIESRLDVEKEAARRERRTVFTFKDWKRHRSSARFMHHLFTIPESGVIKGVLLHVCVFVLLATGVAAYNHCFSVGSLPVGLPAPPRIAIEPIQLTSFALSLLLVFRTNASYSRWLEARKKFGSITTTGKDIARQAFAWFRHDDMDSKRCLTRWLVALALSSMVHLRDGEHELRAMMQGVLEPQELGWLEKSHHKPNFCIQMLTRIISRAGLPTELVLRMDENISKLVQAVSACERILNTPIPMSYTRHTARFLMVWLSCLPFSLWSYCGWAMVPISALISFVLLGIEEIGVYIEEPFSLLPLESLCDKLTRTLKSMMQEHKDIYQYMSDSYPTAAALEEANGSSTHVDASQTMHAQ